MTFQDILKIFEENDNFLILTHKSPDGDTLGSGFALCAFLRDMGKKANVVNSDSFPERYDLIYESYYPQEFDVKYVIAVDIADTNLLGSNLSKYAEEGAIDLCIDHHISNKYYAKQSYVEADASAAALIMYKIFKASGRKISRQIASVEGVKIGITVKQRHENVFKISVRSDDEIDASAFCREFGGGGHIRAAGCEITGSLEEVKAKLLKQAEKVLG